MSPAIRAMRAAVSSMERTRAAHAAALTEFASTGDPEAARTAHDLAVELLDRDAELARLDQLLARAYRAA